MLGAECARDVARGGPATAALALLDVADADPEGKRSIFFELNGQPREVKVADRSLAPSGEARRVADEADPTHVPAPMPGLVVSLSVRIGEKVGKGDRLLSIEAMKMETGVFADRAGAVREILVQAGDQVDTKQLLMVIGDGDDGDAGEAPDEAPEEVAAEA